MNIFVRYHERDFLLPWRWSNAGSYTEKREWKGEENDCIKSLRIVMQIEKKKKKMNILKQIKYWS